MYFFLKILGFKYQPPPAVPDYHIRRHYLFDKIAYTICSDSKKVVPGKEYVELILYGGGGFGKTTMATYLCHHPKVKDTFSNGTIFIELGPESRDVNVVLNEHYCQMTDCNFDILNNVEEKIQELTKIFSNILVIIDDVWVVEDAKAIVKAFCHCKIILTTRIPNIDIPTKQKISVGAMTPKESVSLMTNGILEFNELSEKDIQLMNELAQITHQWPILLALIRGQFSHALKTSNKALRNIILDVHSTLQNKGLAAFDVKAAKKVRQQSVRTCIEVSLGLLDKPTKDKLLSLILYTGIGGSLPSPAVKCLWNVCNESAKATIESLERYGLVHTKTFKQVPPYFAATYKFLTVHSVISDYIMSTIKSETVAQLSPFIFLCTEKLITTVEELLFQQSHMLDVDDKPGLLTYNKQKMEHVVLPYHMKDVNMHVLHDPHLVLLMLHNIQSCLNDPKYFHLLAKFNEDIMALINECYDALTKAQELSIKVNLHFQLCFRKMCFDNLIPILNEYLDSDFILSTTTKGMKLTETISKQCDGDLRAEMSGKCKDFQLLTREFHTVYLEKLPYFELYASLHRSITLALHQKNSEQIDSLYSYITSGKFEEEIEMVYTNYQIKISDGKKSTYISYDFIVIYVMKFSSVLLLRTNFLVSFISNDLSVERYSYWIFHFFSYAYLNSYVLVYCYLFHA